MSVHAYRAVERKSKELNLLARFSYLAPRDLELRFDPREGVKEDVKFKLGSVEGENKLYFDRTHITLNDLLYLHTLKPLNARSDLRMNDIVAAMFRDCLDNLDNEEWKKFHYQLKSLIRNCKKQASYRLSRPQSRNEYEKLLRQKELELPKTPTNLKVALEVRRWTKDGKIILGSLPIEQSAEEFCDFLHGTWLEDYVLGKIISVDPTKGISVKDECNLHDCYASLEVAFPREDIERNRALKDLPFFELDVVAMRGYQLFVISCTLDREVNRCKQKIFEVLLRARQLGGDEARVALVCLANAYDRESLKQQLKDEAHVTVFGKDGLQRLEMDLRKWFRGE